MNFSCILGFFRLFCHLNHQKMSYYEISTVNIALKFSQNRNELLKGPEIDASFVCFQSIDPSYVAHCVWKTVGNIEPLPQIPIDWWFVYSQAVYLFHSHSFIMIMTMPTFLILWQQ